MPYGTSRSFYVLAAALVVVAFLLGAALMSRQRPLHTATAVVSEGTGSPRSQAHGAASSALAADDIVDPGFAYAPERSSDAPLHLVVNGTPLNPEQLDYLRQFGPLQSGRFWYDPRSGLWGVEGHEPSGYVRPGLAFGTLSPRASNGASGVFVNGREINPIELHWYELIFRTPSTGPGRFWLDGVSGNVGFEGNPMPIGNLIRSLQQGQTSAAGSRAFAGGSMVGVTNGNCSMVTTDSGYTAESSGC